MLELRFRPKTNDHAAALTDFTPDAVAPAHAIADGGDNGETDLLASCYRQSLIRAGEVGARSVGIPAISTGIYGFPLNIAAPIAVRTVVEHLEDADDDFDLIALVCFDAAAHAAFSAALENH